MFDAPVLKFDNVLTNPNGKSTYGTTHVLFTACAGQQVHDIGGGTCTKFLMGKVH